MARRKKRPLYFVCSSLTEDMQITSVNIEASSKEEASALYKSKIKVYPEIINGPFYLKKVKIQNVNRKDLVFSNITKKAIYKDFLVSAFLLDSPIDHAYLVYIKNLSNNELIKMKSTVIVPIEQITILKENL